MEEKDWEGALEYGKRDEQLRRLSSGWKVNLAQWYGRVGEFGKAEVLIEEGLKWPRKTGQEGKL